MAKEKEITLSALIKDIGKKEIKAQPLSVIPTPKKTGRVSRSL
jgi:hypothetical protein